MSTQASPRMRVVDDLLFAPTSGSSGWWPRAVAWLLRIELEHDLNQFLESRGVDADGLSGRVRLLMLHAFLNPGDVRLITATWTGLSSAGHHHAYDLAPTQAELLRWRQAVCESPLRATGRSGTE